MAAAAGKGKKTLVRALHDKYSLDEESDTKIFVKVPKGAPGYSEEGKLIVPQNLALNNCSISDAGDSAELKDLCSTVCELDLAENTIQEWTEVFKILSHCPHVTFLNLSKNHLRNSTSVVNDAVKDLELYLDKLEKLVLNSLQLEWSIIWQLLNVLPSLTSLNISKTELGDWTEIEKLRSFPKLSDIRLTSIPFMEDLEEEPRRQRVIAYLPNVERLNGSPVGVTEREDAERAFIRLHLDTEEKPPRCLELESVYGKLDPLVEVDLSSNSDIVQVLVVFKGNSRVIDINIAQTVAEMKKTQLSKIVGLPPAKFRVFHRDIGAPYGDEELRYPNMRLHTVKLKTGDELHVEPK